MRANNDSDFVSLDDLALEVASGGQQPTTDQLRQRIDGFLTGPSGERIGGQMLTNEQALRAHCSPGATNGCVDTLQAVRQGLTPKQ